MIDHGRARALTRSAQAAAVGLVGVIGVFAFAGAPGTRVPEPPEPRPIASAPDPDGPDRDGQAATDEPMPVDFAGLAERLAAFSNAPRPAEPVAGVDRKPVDPQEPVEPDPLEVPGFGAADALAEVRYLGRIVDPKADRAILVVRGVQRLVTVGDEVEGCTLAAVERERAIFDVDGAERSVERAAKRTTAFTTTGVQPGRAAPGMPGATGKDVEDDDRQRMIEERRRQLEQRSRDRLGRGDLPG